MSQQSANANRNGNKPWQQAGGLNCRCCGNPRQNGGGSNGIRTRVSALRGPPIVSSNGVDPTPSKSTKTASEAALIAVMGLHSSKIAKSPQAPSRAPERPSQWQQSGNEAD